MKVQVLMSTYNGEKYVEEQINSITENQIENVEVSLLVRDDGSRDRTLEVLNVLKAKEPIQIEVMQGKNLGVTRSFLQLIKNAPEADLYFFADQDDRWIKDKIATVVDLCKKSDEPEVYVSGYYLTDATLNVQSEWIHSENTENSLLQILFANMVPGCVMGFNKALLLEMQKKLPEDVPMHDIYALATAYCCGSIRYIEKPLVYYRQHGNNVEGVHSEYIDWKRIWKKQKKIWSQKPQHTSELAALLLKKYGYEMPEDEKNNLQLVCGYRNKISSKLKLLFNKEIYYSGIRAKVQTFEKIVMGKF